jgi:hypothetical protein
VDKFWNYLSIFSVFAPLSIGIFHYRQLETNARILLLIVAFASIPQFLTLISPALPVGFYNSYIIVDVILWPLLYFVSSESSKLRKTLLILMLLNVVIDLAFVLSNFSSGRFFYELVCVDSIFQVIYVSLFFYELNLRNEFIDLRRLPLFWFSIGILFYAPCTFFVFLFYFKINKIYGEGESSYLWRIHDFFNILMYVLFAVGLLIKSKRADARI